MCEYIFKIYSKNAINNQKKNFKLNNKLAFETKFKIYWKYMN